MFNLGRQGIEQQLFRDLAVGNVASQILGNTLWIGPLTQHVSRHTSQEPSELSQPLQPPSQIVYKQSQCKVQLTTFKEVGVPLMPATCLKVAT